MAPAGPAVEVEPGRGCCPRPAAPSPTGDAATAAAGEFAIWRARPVGPRGSAIVFVSPRGGVTGSVGVERRIPAGPKDGARRDAWTQNGWWVFSQPFGHPKPVRLEGFDAAGRRIAENRRPVF